MPYIPPIDEDDSDIEVIGNITHLDLCNEESNKSDDSSNLSELTPITVESPVIQIKKSITKESPNKETSAKVKEIRSRIKKKFKSESIESIKEQLKGIVFSGWICEREYLEQLKTYRDKIEIDEWEISLNQKVRAITRSIPGVYEGEKWINITVPTESNPCFCFWVLLKLAPYPGHYWLQIQDVLLDEKYGLTMEINILRTIHQFDGETLEQREKRFKGGDGSTDEWKEWAQSVANVNFKSMSQNTVSILTPHNISKGFRLFVVLSVTLVVGLFSFLKESWHFLLRLLRELGIFVHHATPFLQSVINFGEKVVGGFYLLVAMVYRDIRKPTHEPPPMHHKGPMHRSIAPPGGPSFGPTFVAPQAWVYKND